MKGARVYGVYLLIHWESTWILYTMQCLYNACNGMFILPLQLVSLGRLHSDTYVQGVRDICIKY